MTYLFIVVGVKTGQVRLGPDYRRPWTSRQGERLRILDPESDFLTWFSLIVLYVLIFFFKSVSQIWIIRSNRTVGGASTNNPQGWSTGAKGPSKTHISTNSMWIFLPGLFPPNIFNRAQTHCGAPVNCLYNIKRYIYCHLFDEGIETI